MSADDAFAARCYRAGWLDAMRMAIAVFTTGKSIRYLKNLPLPEPDVAHFRALDAELEALGKAENERLAAEKA